MKYLLLASAIFFLSAFNKPPTDCQTLISQHVELPKKLQFINCEEGTGQTILEAKYKVAGKDSKKVEKFLIKKYNIGKLKFACCGWESSNGKNGYIENEELKKINPNYSIEISMYGNAEIENEQGEVELETDRSKIDFYVFIKLLEV